MLEILSIEGYAYKVLSNTEGFLYLLAGSPKLTNPEIEVRFLMAATGVYHQKFAYFLDDQGYGLSIVFPNKIILDLQQKPDKVLSYVWQ